MQPAIQGMLKKLANERLRKKTSKIIERTTDIDEVSMGMKPRALWGAEIGQSRMALVLGLRMEGYENKTTGKHNQLHKPNFVAEGNKAQITNLFSRLQ